MQKKENPIGEEKSTYKSSIHTQNWNGIQESSQIIWTQYLEICKQLLQIYLIKMK
jgi:hypothetical protein